MKIENKKIYIAKRHLGPARLQNIYKKKTKIAFISNNFIYANFILILLKIKEKIEMIKNKVKNKKWSRRPVN